MNQYVMVTFVVPRVDWWVEVAAMLVDSVVGDGDVNFDCLEFGLVVGTMLVVPLDNVTA